MAILFFLMERYSDDVCWEVSGVFYFEKWGPLNHLH